MPAASTRPPKNSQMSGWPIISMLASQPGLPEAGAPISSTSRGDHQQAHGEGRDRLREPETDRQQQDEQRAPCLGGELRGCGQQIHGEPGDRRDRQEQTEAAR